MALSVGGSVDFTQLDKTLAELGHEVKDARPVFHRIDRDVSTLLREQWQSRGARLGSPWTPVTPATIKIRINRRMMTKKARARASRAAGADTPLYDRGGLYSSFTKPGAPGSIRIIDKLNYERGSGYNVDGFPVALAMQTGFKSTYRPVFDKMGDVTFVRRKVPKQIGARVIIPENLPAPIVSAWEGYFVQYLEKGSVG